MKTRIAKLDEIYTNHSSATAKELGLNRTFCTAYLHSLEAGTDLLDFDDVIWCEDIDEIIRDCKANGIEAFTISCSASGLLYDLAAFAARGLKVDGMVKINSRFSKIGSAKKEQVNAIQLSF